MHHFLKRLFQLYAIILWIEIVILVTSINLMEI